MGFNRMTVNSVVMALIVFAIVVGINYLPELAWFVAGVVVTVAVLMLVLGMYTGDYIMVTTLTMMEIFIRTVFCVLAMGVCEILIYFGHAYVGTMVTLLVFGICLLENLHPRKIQIF